MRKRTEPKKLIFVLLIALTAFFCFLTPIKTVRADSSDSLVMVLVENHDQDQINIDVRMLTNTGVSGMTLELVFDRDAFEFVNYEKGAALDKLDLISTDLNEDKTLPVKFNWLRSGSEFQNDLSTGTILKLRFSVKEGAQSGRYEIGFRYNGGDVVYVDNGSLKQKSAIIGKAKVVIAENKISDVEIVDEGGAGIENGTEGVNGWLMAVVAISSVAVVTLATVLYIKIINKKRGKGNWSQI